MMQPASNSPQSSPHVKLSLMLQAATHHLPLAFAPLTSRMQQTTVQQLETGENDTGCTLTMYRYANAAAEDQASDPVFSAYKAYSISLHGFTPACNHDHRLSKRLSSAHPPSLRFYAGSCRLRGSPSHKGRRRTPAQRWQLPHCQMSLPRIGICMMAPWP